MPINYCDLTWEQAYGTAFSGSLPVNRRYADGSDPNKAGYRYKLCKYSTQSTISGSWPKGNHTQTFGRMRFYQRGSKSVWMCFDDNCPYYTTEFIGRRYFEI
jgi:hypothetical protein